MDQAAMRLPALPVLTVLAIVLISNASGVASGQEIDVSGNWQSNQFFNPPPLETSTVQFLEIMENLSTGELTMIPGPQCGTAILDNLVITSCPPTISTGTIGKVTGTAYASPPDPNDFVPSDAIFDPPIDLSFGCPNTPTSRIAIGLRRDGTIEDDGLGTAVRISGTVFTDGVQFFDSGDNLCDVAEANSIGSFVMLPTDTSTGPNQTVEPLDGATVTFSDVAAEGLTSVTPLSEPNGALPANFKLLPVPIFYDVQTTVTFSGSIIVCLPYPDEDNDGIVDDTSPPLNETDVLILHEEGGVFVDRTASRDTDANQVCAEVTDLSQFALGSGPGAIPSVTRPGLILFALLLLGTSVWLLRRRLAFRT